MMHKFVSAVLHARNLIFALTIFVSTTVVGQPEVTISGTFSVPADSSGLFEVRLNKLDGSDGFNGPWAEVNQQAKSFQATVPAGTYAVQVTAESFFSDDGTFIGGAGAYFSAISVDASNGNVTDVVIPEALANGQLFSHDPPIASLISVGAANDSGIAMITGSAGAASSLATIGVGNLQTGQYTIGTSNADGSFEVPMFAPEGSYLSVHNDHTGLMAFNADPAIAPGTIIRVPVSGEQSGAFATGTKLAANGGFDPVRVSSDGGVDVGQIWLWGNLESRDWTAGQSGTLSGTAKIYSRNIDGNTPIMHGNPVYLERVFDGNGKQEMANPEFSSHFLTPSGIPINRRNAQDPVEIGQLTLGVFNQTSDRTGETSWELVYQLPVDLPNGVYQLVLATGGTDSIGPIISGLEQDTLYTEDVFPHHSDLLFATGGATLINVNPGQSPRLSWVLGLNDFSNGTRGTVALEDRDRLGIAGNVKTNSNDFVVPAIDPRTGEAFTYRLEPFAPLVGAGNRGWINPPTIPFAFPSGQLSVQVIAPNGSVQNLGTVSIAQPYIQSRSSRSGQALPGNQPKQYYGLTTLNSGFDVSFDQYGLHTITMTGSIDDIYGTRYEAGGTYEVYVAKALDLEFGVFPNTPFEVGDVFAPSVIVQPGIPADVEVRVTHYPNSDPEQKVESVVFGQANRFGYFHPSDNQLITFSSPGEYRVDYTVSYVDQDDGSMWMGSRSWGSVVATPNSPIITHGRRGGDIGSAATRPQWFNIKGNSEVEGSHLHFPFANGDVVWMEDTFKEAEHEGTNGTAMLLMASLQDPSGTLANYFRQRAPKSPNYVSVGSILDLEDRISNGEIPLFSSSSTDLSPLLNPDAVGNHWAYFYSGAAKPGVAAREAVSEDDTGNTYWRFDDSYNHQLGNGANGDLPNDFKFLFSGAVYRAPDDDFYYYGAYGGLWVMTPHDDPIGGRTMPPFQGAAGGPSGGPIMTLKGKDIDMFFHPLGVRAGSILEVGDLASFSGQIAPTLDSKVVITVTSPSGQIRNISGQANQVGYFNNPSSSFAVDEPGVYTVDVSITHDGQTSAGPVEAPFPTGDVLGSDAGRFEFYVVSPASQVASVNLASQSIVQPGNEIVTMPLSAAGLSNTEMHYTTVMPGFILDQGSSSSLNHSYDASALAQDFPNIDLVDADQRYGVDTITLSYLISGTNEQGDTEYRARQVLLQGEELLALEPPLPTTAAVTLNMPDTSLSTGEQLTVSLDVSGNGDIDLYVALLFPNGAFLTIANPLTLSDINVIIPYTLSQDVTNGLHYSIIDTPLPEGVEAGEYTFFGIAVKAGNNVSVESNWLSVAQLSFTINE